MAQGRVKIGVGFDVDKSGLNELKSSLVNLQNATKLDVFNTSTTKKELAEIQQSANQVAAALNKSYNAKLGTYNIEAFKKEINATTGGLSALQQQWSKVATGERAFRNLANSLTSTNLELKETHSLLDSMGTTLMNTIKWSIASTAVNTVTGSIQKAWSFTKQLDESLTNIMIVTEKSSDQMAAFARQANTAAKALGASTRAYSDAALIYYQQGLGDDEVISRTNTTLKAANVTGQNAAQVSEQLTAVWNGYKVATQETELYVDKLSAVAATTAADLEELSTGMSKVASAASTMGVDIDQLNAQLATVISVTRQAPESVGTAFKTIFARMGDIEAGLDTETTLGEYTSKMEAMGFHVLDANNQLRDQGEVIEEIGAKWKSMSREQQVALAQTMAGTRQYNNLLALFDNWGMYEKALQTSANAAGTLSQQNEEYLGSLEAKMQQLTTTAEDLYLSLFDSDSFKDGIDLLTKGVDVLGQFVESVGGGGTVLLSLGTIMTRVFSKQISQSIATTATNFINAKQNAEALAITMQNIKDLDALDMDEATKSILNMKERLVSLRQAGLLTNEQFEDLTRQIKDFSDAADEASIIKERAQQLDNSMRFNPIVLSRSADEEQYPKGGIKNYNLQKVIEQSEAQYQELGTTNIDTNTAYSNLKKQLAAMVEDATKFKTTINEALQNFNTVDIEKFQKGLSGSGGWFALSESDLVSEETVSRIKEVSAELASLTTKMKQSNITAEEREALQKEYANLVKNKLSPLWKEAEKEANKTAEEIRKTGEEIANGALHASDVTVKGIQDTFKKIDLTQAIQKVVNFTSAVGSAASALNILGNIDNIWSNEDLSTGEKMTQTIMNVTSAAGMLLPLIQGITSWTIKNKAAKEAENIVMAKSAAKLAAENKMKRLKLALDKAEGDAIKTKKFWLQQATGIKRQLTKEEKEEIELLRTQNKELSQNTKEKLLNLQVDKVRDKTYNENYKESTILDIFSDKWDKTKANFKQGWQGFTGTAAKGSSAAASIGSGIAAALPYAVILAALVAAIATSWTVAQKKNEEEEKAWKKASEALEDANKHLNEVTEEWDNLESSLKNLESGVQTLEELTEGTVEWKKALYDVNTQVMDLLTQYPELANYIERDLATGQLSITKEGKQIVQNKQLGELNAAQGANALARLQEQSAKQEKLLNDLVDQNSDADVANAVVGAGGTAAIGAVAGIWAGPIGAAVGAAIGAGVGIIGAAVGTAIEDANEEELKNELRKEDSYLTKALEASTKYGTQIFESEEALAKALDLDVNALDKNYKALVENSKEIRALAEVYAQNKAQEYDQKLALGRSIIGEDAAEGAAYLAGDMASEVTEEFINSFESKFSGNTKDTALAEEYARLIGKGSQITNIDDKGKNKIVITYSDGSSEEWDANRLLTHTQNLAWQEDAAKNGNTAAIKAWNKVSKVLGDTEVEDALAQVINKAAGASFEGLTSAEFDKIKDLSEDEFKEMFSTYASEARTSVDELWETFTESAKATSNKWLDMLDGLSPEISSIFTTLIDELALTGKGAAGFANILHLLQTRFGEANALALLNNIEGLSEEDREKLIEGIGGANWEGLSEEAVAKQLESIVKNSDIAIDLGNQNALIEALQLVAGNGFSLEGQQEQYRNLQSLLKDVTDNGVIAAEQYEKLTTLEKSYFQVMADGTVVLKTEAADFYSIAQKAFNLKWTNNLIGAFEAIENQSANIQTAKDDRDEARRAAEKSLENNTNEYNALFSTREAIVADTIRSLNGKNLWTPQNSDTYNKALEEGLSEYDAFMKVVKAAEDNKYMQGALTGELGMRASVFFKTDLNEINSRLSTLPDIISTLQDEVDAFYSHDTQYDTNISDALIEKDRLEKQLEKVIASAFEASGGGLEFASWIESLKTQYVNSPEILTVLEKLLADNPVYNSSISATRKAQQIDALQDDTYRLWGNKGADLELLADLEQYDASIAAYDDTLADLREEYDELESAAKFDNLISQFNTARAQADKLKAQLIVLRRAALEPLNEKVNALSKTDNALFIGGTKDDDKAKGIVDLVEAELRSGELTKKTRNQLQNLLAIGNYDLAEQQWIKDVINLYDSALTKFDEHSDKLIEANRQVREALISTFEESTAQLNDYYDTQIGYLETSISLLDHQVELNKLINGEDSVSKDQLEGIAEARKKIYEQRKAELTDWSQSYSKLAPDDLSAKANEVRDQYYQAAQDAAQAEIEMIQAYTDANTAAVTKSIEDILGTSLSALARLKEEADWTAAMGDRYLSERDKAFGLDTLKYTYGQAARETVDLKVREEINALLDQELEALEAKDALTQADLDRANQQLEILKARIALERAEQDMSNMRLVRGANGEYSYQFVANPAARAEAEQKYREEVEKGRQMNEEALNASTNNTYEAITSLTDYLKEATEGGINEQEGRRIEALVGEISRAASRIKGDLDAVGADLGIDTTQKDWWLDEANQALLRTEGFVPEWIDALMKGEYDKLDADTLTQMSDSQLNDLFSKVFGDEWQKVIDAANEDAKNAAENMVGPEYLKGQIDRVVEALGLLSQGKEVPKWLWADENDAASGAPKTSAAPQYKPVITGIDGTRIESAIRGGVATTVSNFEGINNRVHLTPVDAGNGVVEQKVEIVANFPDATDRDEIKAAFDDLIGLAVQHANQNVKGK